MAMELKTARTATGPRQVMMEDETFAQRFIQPVVDYLNPKNMWARFNNTTPEQLHQAGQFDKWAEGKDWKEIVSLEGAPKLSPLAEPIDPVGAITPFAFRRVLRGAVKARASRFGHTAEKLAGELAKVDDLAASTPPGLVDWLRSFKLKSKLPGAKEGHGYYFASKRQAYLDPYSIKYDPMELAKHEIHGHATQDIFRHKAPLGSHLEDVQLHSDRIVEDIHQLKSQLGYLRKIQGVGPPKDLITRKADRFARTQRLDAIEKVLDDSNTGERIANYIEDYMGQGMAYNDAVKKAYTKGKGFVKGDLKRVRAMTSHIEEMLFDAGGIFFELATPP